jgi:hypothetical protein
MPSRGLPQGWPLSLALAKLYTEGLTIDLAAVPGVRFWLFVDDGLIAARSPDALRRAEQVLLSRVGRLGLSLNSDKNARLRIDSSNGVPFLGFRLSTAAVLVGPERERSFRLRLLAAIRASHGPSEAVKVTNALIVGLRRPGRPPVSWIRYYAVATSSEPFRRLDRAVRRAFRARFGDHLSNRKLARQGLRGIALDAERLRRRQIEREGGQMVKERGARTGRSTRTSRARVSSMPSVSVPVSELVGVPGAALYVGMASSALGASLVGTIADPGARNTLIVRELVRAARYAVRRQAPELLAALEDAARAQIPRAGSALKRFGIYLARFADHQARPSTATARRMQEAQDAWTDEYWGVVEATVREAARRAGVPIRPISTRFMIVPAR